MSEETAPVADAAPVAAPVEAPAPAPETPEAAEEPGPLAPRFAALAKREKDIVAREKRLKDEAAAREATFAAREKDIESRLAQVSSVDDLLKLAKEKPTAFFEKTGLTFQALTDAVLREGEPPSAEDRVAKLEAKLEAEAKERAEAEERRKKEDEERKVKAVEEAVSSFKADISKFVDSHAETYELVAAEGASDLVFDLIEEHYRRTQSMLSIERAASMAEAYFLERLKSSKKLAALFAPAPPPPPAKPVVAKKTTTLSNKTGMSGAVSEPEKKPLLTPREIAEKFRRMRRQRNAGA